MYAEVEHLSAVIRVFGPGRKRPDPYEYVATLRWVNPERVEIVGVLEAPSMEQVVAMARALEAVGVKTVFWLRYDGKRQHEAEFNVPRIVKRAERSEQR